MTGTVIVGSSIGGVRAAQALRSEGYRERVTLIGEERDPPYDKPPLSKGFLRGHMRRDANILMSHEEASDLGIELMLGERATGLNLRDCSVQLSSGAKVPYKQLIIATGATARTPPWGVREGIHVLRTLKDADALRASVADGGPVVIIGAGFIGVEVAATLRLLDMEVTLIDPNPLPMKRALDPIVGEWFRDYYLSQGVRLEMGVGVADIEGVKGNFTIILTDGRSLPAATIVAGLGAQPNTQWLESSGLQLRDGVVTDEFCRVQEAPDIHAIGDVARWCSVASGEDVRLEHWTNAVDQATFVAHNIVAGGPTIPYSPVPYVWSDQYDWKLQIVGNVQGKRRWVVGDPFTDGKAVALYGDATGSFTGSITLNWPRAQIRCRQAALQGAYVPDLAETLAGTLVGAGIPSKQ